MLVKVSPDHPPMAAPYTEGPMEPREWKPLDFNAEIVDQCVVSGRVRFTTYFPASEPFFI